MCSVSSQFGPSVSGALVSIAKDSSQRDSGGYLFSAVGSAVAIIVALVMLRPRSIK